MALPDFISRLKVCIEFPDEVLVVNEQQGRSQP